MATRVTARLIAIADDRVEGVGEGLLGTQYVVVEAGYQSSCLGTGKKGDRHTLDVRENLVAHVEYEALPHPRGDPALPKPEGCVKNREARDEYGEPDHERPLVAFYPLVDDGPVHQRVSRTNERVDDDQHHEQCERKLVGLGKAHDAPDCALWELVGGYLLVLAQRTHEAPADAASPAAHPHAHVVHKATVRPRRPVT